MGRDGVQKRRLARTGTAGDEHVQLPSHALSEELGGLLGDRSQAHQVRERERVAGELSDRQRRPAQRERRDDRVDAAAVRQTGIHHRRRLVDASAHLRDDSVDDAEEMRVVEERCFRLLDHAAPLDEELVVAVDHDLRHRRVVQERLQRPVAEDVVRDLPLEPRTFARAERRLFGIQLLADELADARPELVRALEVQKCSAEPRDAGAVDSRLELGLRVACSCLQGALVDLEPLGQERRVTAS